jgi:hypothetical protein
MQTVAARILWGAEAVAKCRRVRARGHEFVQVARDHAGGRARYRGLQTCGSVWHCPICAAEISARRQDDVRAVIEAARAAGHVAYLCTYTIPHEYGFGTCEGLKKGVSEAYRRLQQGRAFQTWKAESGLVGTIRAIETTHGANGWHPHLHVVYIFQDDPGDQAGAWLHDRWGAIVADMGMGQISRAAQDFQKCHRPRDAGDYVAKWGPHAELTKALFKRANGGNRGPFQILDDMAAACRAAKIEGLDDPLYTPGTDAFRDRLIWEEYAAAFKGTRQIGYSHGLREAYGLRDPVSDEKAAEGPDATEVQPFMYFPPDVWSEVKKNGLQAAVLDLAEIHDAQTVCRLLAEGLRDARGFRHPKIRGAFPAWRPPPSVPTYLQEVIT